jgi:hypothetical protein
MPMSVSILSSCRLSAFSRTLDMLCVEFLLRDASHDGSSPRFMLHVQCPWRLEGAKGIITGRQDVWEYAGPGQEPDGWVRGGCQDCLLDGRMTSVFGPRTAVAGKKGSWWPTPQAEFDVQAVETTPLGDIRLILSGGYALQVFPSSTNGEEWRLFDYNSDAEHLVFREHEP